MKIRLNIVAKLALIFVLFAALLLAAVGVLSYTSGRAALQAAAVSELFSTAIEKQSSLNDWITETQTHATSLSASPYLQANVADLLAARGSGDQAAIQAVHDRLIEELQVWVGQGRDYLEWFVLDPDSGQVIASTDPGEEGKFREDQPYFINGKSSLYLQDLYYSPATQGTLLTVSAPVRSGNGTLLAVLAGNLDLAKMNAIISRRTGLRQSDDAYLINTSELFVTQPRFLSDPAILRLGVHTEAVKRCLVRNSGMVIAPDYRGIPAVVIYRWLPEHQLCLIVKMDQAEALAPALALRNNILLFSFLAMMAAAVLAWWLARTITRPVQQLAEAVREIGAGKLDTPIDIKNRDEIGQLAGAFVQMTESLQKTLVSRDDLLAEIAERKKAEETLRQSEEKYRHLFQNAQVGMYRSKLDGSAILAVNRKLCETFGFSEEEMIENPATIRWANPAARDQMVAELRQSGSLHDYDMSILTKSGEVRTCVISVSLNPGLGYLEGSMIDNTERKRAEQALQRSEEKYRALFQNAQIGMFRSKLDGSAILAVNRKYCEIYGFDEEEMLGNPFTIRWAHPEIRDRMVSELRKEGSLHDYEVEIVTKSGEVRICSLSAQIEVEQAYLEGSIIDITERKRVEEALNKTLADLERSNSDLEQFAYVASHDLQEPLRMVSSFTQLLAQRYKNKLDKEADEFIAYAVDGANHMQRLINDLLSYSRVGTRGKPPEPVPADAALDRALENLGIAVEESRAQIEREPLPTVTADEVQLIRVFQNLIANAIKFRGDDPPRIYIGCQARDSEWVFSIRDNGIGIDPQYLERIFIIFQRLHKRGQYPGTGIGLAICKKIILRHGGRIWVESEPGKGSTFYFSMPKTGGK
jgi:PAS domain S-box-containing protein